MAIYTKTASSWSATRGGDQRNPPPHGKVKSGGGRREGQLRMARGSRRRRQEYDKGAALRGILRAIMSSKYFRHQTRNVQRVLSPLHSTVGYKITRVMTVYDVIRPLYVEKEIIAGH